jgi:predicted site-specific integrase-resolvase
MKNKTTIETTASFLTAKELSQRWKVSLMFLHRLRRGGRLPVTRISKRAVRFALADVLKIEAESAA